MTTAGRSLRLCKKRNGTLASKLTTIFIGGGTIHTRTLFFLSFSVITILVALSCPRTSRVRCGYREISPEHVPVFIKMLICSVCPLVEEN